MNYFSQLMSKPLLINPRCFPNNFDIIRFILASSVIMCHSFAIYWGYDKFSITEPFMVWSQKQISIGSVAVDLFFIISGFLIVKSFESTTNPFDYFKKRVLRIYPGFIVAFILSVLVVGFIGSGWQCNWEGYKQYFNYLLIKKELVHLFTLQSPYQRIFFKDAPEPGVNDSLWTIQFEFACYILVPFIAWMGYFKKKWILITLFVMFYLLTWLQSLGYIFPYNNKTHLFFGNPYFLPRFISYFLAGACFYFYRAVIIRSNLLALLSCIALYGSFVWIKCIDQVLPLAGSYLLFYLAFHNSIRFHNFAKYGDLSYGIYLYGWPIQALVMFYLKEYINPYSFFIIALPIAFIAAYCSWHLLEKPFLLFKKSKKNSGFTH